MGDIRLEECSVKKSVNQKIESARDFLLFSLQHKPIRATRHGGHKERWSKWGEESSTSIVLTSTYSSNTYPDVSKNFRDSVSISLFGPHWYNSTSEVLSYSNKFFLKTSKKF